MRTGCRLERVIRDLVVIKDYPRVEAILEQLCNEFAYAVHQPHARNGGLIGLAAAAIALGSVRPATVISCALLRRHVPSCVGARPVTDGVGSWHLFLFLGR